MKIKLAFFCAALTGCATPQPTLYLSQPITRQEALSEMAACRRVGMGYKIDVQHGQYYWVSCVDAGQNRD